MFGSSDNFYQFGVAGTDQGVYGLDIMSVEYGNVTCVTAVAIPIQDMEMHRYSIDWDKVIEGESGVTVEVDVNGDGVFDRASVAGNNVTEDDFRAATFVRGEINGDGSMDIADAIALLFHLFASREITCGDAGDANDDGTLNISDAIYVLRYLFIFSENAELPAPFNQCGFDTTADVLTCRDFTPCL